MAVYKCIICGYEFDEAKEGKSFDEIEKCPLCKMPKNNMILESGEAEAEEEETPQQLDLTEEPEKEAAENPLAYDNALMRPDPSER